MRLSTNRAAPPLVLDCANHVQRRLKMLSDVSTLYPAFPGQNAKLTRILLNPADTLAVSAASPVRQQARRSPARAR
jgi:hypothetical protein